MPITKYSTWINIDLTAIEHNVTRLRYLTGTPVMAVIKANGYGHGTVPVARAALRAGAQWLGVARLEEALELRADQITSPILVLGYTPPERFLEAILEGVSITIWGSKQLLSVARAAQDAHAKAKIHLKIDTGMSRLGIEPANALSFAQEIVNTRDVKFEGIFTHYARADELDQVSALEQESIFIQVLGDLARTGIRPEFVHAANSAAALFQPNSRFSLVRTGIAIYGLHPSAERHLPGDFQAALEWKAVLSQVRILPPASGVSYGHEYITRDYERIGTVPVGYADGLRRASGKNQVLVGGVLVPIVGRVCMDQVSVQLDQVPNAQAGDEVVIIGSQGESRITAEQVADRWGTINYEVVCGLSARVPRFYH
ncbi:MAG: alanine racemase [Anaerolineales bacterium]